MSLSPEDKRHILRSLKVISQEIKVLADVIEISDFNYRPQQANTKEEPPIQPPISKQYEYKQQGIEVQIPKEVVLNVKHQGLLDFKGTWRTKEGKIVNIIDKENSYLVAYDKEKGQYYPVEISSLSERVPPEDSLPLIKT